MSQSFVKPTAPTQSAGHTSHSRWPNTRSLPSLNRPKEGAGKKKFRIYSLSSGGVYQRPKMSLFDFRQLTKYIITGMIGSSRDLVASPSLSWGRRRRRRRSWCWGWSARCASGRTRSALKLSSTNDSQSNFQAPIKRTKHFELGGEKKRKGQMIQF